MDGIVIFTIEIILSFLAFTANTYLGLTIYIRNPKSWTNTFFALLALVLDSYILVNLFSLHPPVARPEVQLFWIRAVMFSASFMGPLLFLLVHTFPGNKITLSRQYLIGVLALMLITAAISFTPLIYSGITYPGGSPTPSPGPGMILFAVDFIGFILLSFVVLTRKYNRATGNERMSLSFLRLGVFTTFFLITISTVFLVVVFETPAGVFLGPIFPVILTSAIAYAIAKHRFLDIQPILARTVSFLILIASFATAYSLIIFSVVRKILDIQINTSIFLIFLALSIIAMLTFESMQNGVKRLTNHLFFKGQYDRNELLSRLTHIMAETIELDKLMFGITQAIAHELHISKMAFLIIEDHKVSEPKGIGYGQANISQQELEILFHNPFIIGRQIVFEDLAEGKLKEMFRKHELSIAIPIRVKDSEVAILIVGPKLSGEPYFARDIDFLDIAASGSGIAIQNAKSFEEIKKFSRELEKKVEERTQALKEVQERELAKAREVSRLKDEFVFIAAHELRTPVTVIRGFLELVFPALKGFPKDVRHHLNAITLASNNLNQLIDDLLEIARSESEKLKIIAEETDIVKLIKTVIIETKSLANEKKIKIEVRLTEPIPKAIADPLKVKEVLTNLLSNAIKYNRDGGEVVVTVLRHGGKIIVEVRDTGYGIPKNEQEKIFQKFSRVSTKETRTILGTGLGLFISRMLVEKMGGKITFSSTPDQGTTFAFSLPIKIELD